MTSKENPYQKCQICGKERMDNGEPQWNVLLRFVHITTNHVTMEICVCHDCMAKYKLREIIDNRNRGIQDEE